MYSVESTVHRSILWKLLATLRYPTPVQETTLSVSSLRLFLSRLRATLVIQFRAVGITDAVLRSFVLRVTVSSIIHGGKRKDHSPRSAVSVGNFLFLVARSRRIIKSVGGIVGRPQRIMSSAISQRALRIITIDRRPPEWGTRLDNRSTPSHFDECTFELSFLTCSRDRRQMIITSTISPSLRTGLRFLGTWPDMPYANVNRLTYILSIAFVQYFQYLYTIAHFKPGELQNLVDSLAQTMDYTLTIVRLLTLWKNRR